jgi:ubiquinone/menaquinone biosynthesis C-methylase UbiE/uncharacterized protein YbaR (Trm112 family)
MGLSVLQNDILVCPECKLGLERDGEFAICVECRFRYKIYNGVMNLRREELFKGECDLLDNISAMFEKLNFGKFVEYCDAQTNKDVLPWETRRKSRLCSLNLIEKEEYYSKYGNSVLGKIGSNQLSITKSIFGKIGKTLNFKEVLDMGTGRGPWAISAAKTFIRIIGLDIDMVSLLIAEKYCLENRIDNVLFVSGFAEKLPFKDCTFDLVNCQSSLEHFSAQLKAIFEINRVLSTGGYCLMDSPNRFNVLSPEKHTSIWFLGFLPRKVAHLLSIKWRGLPFYDIRLLSYFKIKKFAKGVFDDTYEILSALDVKEMQRMKILIRIPFIKLIMKLIGPWHYLVGRKT